MWLLSALGYGGGTAAGGAAAGTAGSAAAAGATAGSTAAGTGTAAAAKAAAAKAAATGLLGGGAGGGSIGGGPIGPLGAAGTSGQGFSAHLAPGPLGQALGHPLDPFNKVPNAASAVTAPTWQSDLANVGMKELRQMTPFGYYQFAKDLAAAPGSFRSMPFSTIHDLSQEAQSLFAPRPSAALFQQQRDQYAPVI